MYQSGKQWSFNTVSDEKFGATFNYLTFGRIVPTLSKWKPNMFDHIDGFIAEKTYNPFKLCAKFMLGMTYGVVDDIYTIGTRSTRGGSRHLSGAGASPQEVVDSGMSLFSTIVTGALGKEITISAKGIKYNMNSYRKVLNKNSTIHITKNNRRNMKNLHNYKLDQNGKMLRDIKE